MTEIRLDTNRVCKEENRLYRGLGMVSANNSSRLLMDYKALQPERYWELLELLFGAKGLHLAHLKIEMGSDVNSSSGTEPCIMRTPTERPDVTRGAGFMLAADAKRVNPDLTLDMLWWSEPKWIDEAEDEYDARYRWYKANLDAAYETYGLQFDYVSTTQNERAWYPEWIKYLAGRLKEETDCPYPYRNILLVAGDEVCTWNIADLCMEDAQLRDSIAVIGSHYTSDSWESAKTLCREYGKELWFSEGSTSMGYPKSSWRYDEGQSGLTGLNGVLDITSRLLAMYPNGMMTLCQLQPVISAYYDGVCYCQKDYVTASTPWNGYYSLNAGYYGALHFTRFLERGYRYLPEGCFCDGELGGDGHCLVNVSRAYNTLVSPDGGDFVVVIANSTASEQQYRITYSEEEQFGSLLGVFETRGPSGGAYDENYFRKTAVRRAETSEDGTRVLEWTVAPYSIVTITTKYDAPERELELCAPGEQDNTVLELPVSLEPETDLKSRGMAPLFTTDQGGAFEFAEGENGLVLRQQITEALRAKEWGYTPKPFTCFGDDRWYNYEVHARVRLMAEADFEQSYAGLGLRCVLSCEGAHGYWVRVVQSGRVELCFGHTVLETRELALEPGAWCELSIAAEDNRITARAVSAKEMAELTVTEPASLTGDTKEAGYLIQHGSSGGRAALYASFHAQEFSGVTVSDVRAEQTGAERTGQTAAAVLRADQLEPLCEYCGSWTHELMASFVHFRRTRSIGEEGAEVNIHFCGTRLFLTGEQKAPARLRAVLDGREFDVAVQPCGARGVNFELLGLPEGEHELTLTVLAGSYCLDQVAW